MRLEQSFEVPVPVAVAWGVLLDVERIAPCMPGATLTGFDGTLFNGLVKLKLGPISLSYKGAGRFVERDDSGKRVVIVASGQDSRGAGGVQVRITAVLHNANGGATTQVKVVTDLDVAGKAAQFGRGMIADVSVKLIKQFSDCLARTIAESPVTLQAPVAPIVEAPAEEPAAPNPEPAAPEALVIEPIAAPVVAEVPAPEPKPATVPVPEPVVLPVTAPPQATPLSGPAPAGAEPVDVLASTGAKSPMRRAAPLLIAVGILIIALMVWLIVA